MSRCVVVDANRIFSELIAGNHHLRRTFAREPDTEFVCPKYVMVELFKHKERIVAATGLDETTLLALLHTLLDRIRFFDQDAISIGCWAEAWRLCRDVDENDVAYVALAAINDPATVLHVSHASLWEITLKHGAGKLALPDTESHKSSGCVPNTASLKAAGDCRSPKRFRALQGRQ